MFNCWEKVEKEQVIFVLSELKSLFSNKDVWMDWPQAMDKNGTEVDPLDENAVKFSLMGASFKIACSKYETPLANYIDVALRDHLLTIGNKSPGEMISYEDEISSINLALDQLQKE